MPSLGRLPVPGSWPKAKDVADMTFHHRILQIEQPMISDARYAYSCPSRAMATYRAKGRISAVLGEGEVIVESTGNRHNDAVEETDGIVRFLEVMLEDPSIQVVLGDRHYNKENWAVWTA